MQPYRPPQIILSNSDDSELIRSLIHECGLKTHKIEYPNELRSNSEYALYVNDIEKLVEKHVENKRRCRQIL